MATKFEPKSGFVFDGKNKDIEVNPYEVKLKVSAFVNLQIDPELIKKTLGENNISRLNREMVKPDWLKSVISTTILQSFVDLFGVAVILM